ncbi:hypothetical protein RHSIM_Rhsim05G0034600 [Rhododendron simsii]|uniref:Transposase-associated domain-containing protein n=1 Tax=Rhododendron simsii TaxID=118357 RepID=A0A834H250_RHOSS|nr:hypothetical protein RHSIM_Rhsim05G0024300 [Rhododendron simsii]KAF7144002.1 hypothetical protein RHSIM_Rhsim05G0034600 [Rhododendron simsii]
MSRDYFDGIDRFLEFAYTDKLDDSFISCPCRKCENRYSFPRAAIRKHLYSCGFFKKYKNWTNHGESYAFLSGEQGYGTFENSTIDFYKFNAMPLDYYKLPPTDFSAPETSMKKCGRGSAKGIHQWGTGTKLKVMFDNDFQPLGDEGSRLKGQLGTMLRNPHRIPLTYLDWNSVPEEIKSAIWKEIEDNIEDCPAEFQPVAMHSCNKLWKDHKAKTKDKYYTKHEEDQDILLKVPKRVLPDQWKELVSYWTTTDAKDGHEKVCLVSYTIPKHDVAEGIVVSKDPLVKVDGKPLGSDF